MRSKGLEPPRFYSLPPQGSASTVSPRPQTSGVTLLKRDVVFDRKSKVWCRDGGSNSGPRLTKAVLCHWTIAAVITGVITRLLPGCNGARSMGSNLRPLAYNASAATAELCGHKRQPARPQVGDCVPPSITMQMRRNQRLSNIVAVPAAPIRKRQRSSRPEVDAIRKSSSTKMHRRSYQSRSYFEMVLAARIELATFALRVHCATAAPRWRTTGNSSIIAGDFPAQIEKFGRRAAKPLLPVRSCRSSRSRGAGTGCRKASIKSPLSEFR